MKIRICCAILIAGLVLSGCSSIDASQRSAPESLVDQIPAEQGTEQQPGSKEPEGVKKEALNPIINAWALDYLPQFEAAEKNTPVVTLHTTKGDIKLMLFPQTAPKTVENFVTHCEAGYYDGIIFHRVMENFMIQGGDPQGTGSGGASVWGHAFLDEFSDNLHHFRGAISMANSGINTNGSQFFIVQSSDSHIPGQEEGIMRDMLLNELQWRLTTFAQQGCSEAEYTVLLAEYEGILREVDQNGFTEEQKARYQTALEKYTEVGGTYYLDYKHTVFGQVIEGMDVVDRKSVV